MKLLRSHLFRTLMFIAAVMCLQSCSNKNSSINDKIDAVVSEDVDLVFAGDIQRILSATEIQVKDGGLVLPDYMSEMAELGGRYTARQFDEVQDKMSENFGIDYTNVVVAVKNMGARPDAIIAFNVSDVNALYSTMEDIDSDVTQDEINGFTILGDEYASLVIDDGVAYMMFKKGKPLAEDDAVEALEKWQEKAQSKPLAEWKKNYLTENAVGSLILNFSNLADMADFSRDFRELRQTLSGSLDINLKDVSMGIRLNLEGNTAKANLSMFDKDGNILKNPYGGQFDAGLLKYTTDSDVIAAGIALNSKCINEISGLIEKELKKEMDEYRRELNQMDPYYYFYDYYRNQLNTLTEIYSFVTELSNTIDGNAMMAFGYNPNEISSISDLSNVKGSLAPWHIVMAVKTKNGKGRELYNTVCGLIGKAAAETERNATLMDSTAVYQSSSAPTGNEFKADFYQRSGYNGYTWNYSVAYSVYVNLDGDNLVMSNLPITRNGGSNFNRELLEGKYLAAQLSIPADMKLLAPYDLPCGLSVIASAENFSCDMEVSLPGTNQNIIPAIFKIIIGAASGL